MVRPSSPRKEVGTSRINSGIKRAIKPLPDFDQFICLNSFRLQVNPRSELRYMSNLFLNDDKYQFLPLCERIYKVRNRLLTNGGVLLGQSEEYFTRIEAYRLIKRFL